MNVLLSEMAGKSGFTDLVIVASIFFYVASRVIRQTWEGDGPTRLKTAIAWTFYAFGVVLLAISLAKIPGCESQRDKPAIQQQQLPVSQGQMSSQSNVTKHQKK